MPAGTAIATTDTADPGGRSLAGRLVWGWLVPVGVAVLVAAAVDVTLIAYEAVGPASVTRYGVALNWLRLLPPLVAGAAVRVALPASALCGILYLLRTGKPPFRHTFLAGLALSLGWAVAVLTVLPPKAPPVYRVSIGPGPAPVPRDPAAWPPFGPAYFPYIEAFAALAAASRAWRA